MLEGIEVQQYFHSDETPQLIDNEQITNGFHINFVLKDTFTKDMVDKMIEMPFSVFQSN